jgi:hypothetical protein
MEVYKCEYCKISCKNKYILDSHLKKSKKCLSLRGLELDEKDKFICKGCNSVFSNNKNLNVHTSSCKDFALNKLSNELKEKHEKELLDQQTKYEKELLGQQTKYEKELLGQQTKHDKELVVQQTKYEKELLDQKSKYEKELLEYKCQLEIQQNSFKIIEKQLEYAQTSFENLSKEAINRPTSTTTNNTINNIRTILSTNHTLDNLKEEELYNIFKENLTEDILLGGQRAIAKICNEKIIQKDDKMLICCTDASRDKYKYMDKDGNIKEDISARNFTNIIIRPLETVGQNVYENACANIEEEREQLSVIEYSKQASLNSKKTFLMNSMVDLRSINCPSFNSKFLTELAILTKV